MFARNALIECVPNFSEGRNKATIAQIVDCFKHHPAIQLLNYSSDSNHNRMVVTALGHPDAMKQVVIDAIGKAVECIDLTKQAGAHPRLGAADVIPFVPIRAMTMTEAVLLAKEVSQEVAKRHQLPIYLYEEAATAPHRINLAAVRSGQFEGLSEKMASPLWVPDYGPSTPHLTAGASIVGARKFLIAWNVNLKTDRLEVAKALAQAIRFSSGGLPFVKALGLSLPDKGLVQVSMNLTDYTQTSMLQVFDCLCKEAAKFNVEILESELIGLLPQAALTGTTSTYLKIKDFSPNRILENHFTSAQI